MTLHLLIMGPPEAGKGTQANRLVARFGFLHLATGDMLRALSREDSPRGRQVDELLRRGEYVPDALVTQLVAERMDDRDVLLDGFPRTVAQAQALDALGVPIHCVLVLDVPDETLIARAAHRLFCPNCGAIYSMAANPPRAAGICDVCGHGLAQRVDDAPQTARHRLGVYHQRSEPVIAYYEQRGLVRHIDGQRPIEQVAATLRSVVAELLARRASVA